MVSTTKSVIVFLGFGMMLSVRGDEDNLRMYNEFEQALLQQIKLIHADCQVGEIEKTTELRLTYQRRRNDGQELALDMKFLQAVVAAHDPGYDIYNPPPGPARVVPPFPFWPGDSLEQIEDPVIRENYKNYLEARSRHSYKYYRETSLYKTRKRLIWSLQTGLFHLKGVNPSRLPYSVMLLDETIADKEVKREILAGVMHKINGTQVNYKLSDKPLPPLPTPPVDAAHKFISLLSPDQCGKVIDEIKAMYTEEELKLLEAPHE